VAGGYFCFSADLHPAIACCLTAPSGSGEALTISSQTSRAAVRVAAASPVEAFSQIASILLRVEPDSVGIALAPRLHDSTAVAAAPVAVVVLGVVELDVAVVLAVLPLVELLLELPHPASSAAAASGINSQVKSVRIV
jgi:hypothetical protein